MFKKLGTPKMTTVVKMNADDLLEVEGDDPISDVLSVNIAGETDNNGVIDALIVEDSEEPIVLMLPVKMIEGVDLTDPKNLSAKYIDVSLGVWSDYGCSVTKIDRKSVV